MKYVILVSITFVATLILGAISAMVEIVSPWDTPLKLVTSWLIKFDSVRLRYERSVSFCGDCGDLYLLTIEFFLLLTLFYLLVLAHALLQSEHQKSTVTVAKESPQKKFKAIGMLVFSSSVMIGMFWSLLFSGLAQGSLISNSLSEYSLFGFMLILQTSFAFHGFIFCVMAFVIIIKHSMRH